jgi:glycyl-tRNA synthetase
MNKPLSFQEIIMTLDRYWADQGMLVWMPYHETVGAGTGNPGTILRVLGPEPWNIAYPEPSFRPDDGRFGDNPNRMQMHTQYQVILQPDPGNPQELYLNSLFAIGLKREEHDIRFVEDNWESPALGAWGLGWEVWLDGMEISQYTYFQQAGGMQLDPVAVELTYGLERIAMYLQNVDSVWKIDWDGKQSYGDILLRQEIEHCEYNFNVADIDKVTEMYNGYEAEAYRCLENSLVIPAHDYVLKCSHVFNILDTRGAIGVTERAAFFGRMRRLSQKVSKAFVAQREEFGYPLMKFMPGWTEPVLPELPAKLPETPQSFLLEIGSEELPSHDLADALAFLESRVPNFFAELRLEHGAIRVVGTPRRLAVIVDDLSPRQEDLEEQVRGPSAKAAFDADGNPTKAAQGFARSKGVDVADLDVREIDGGEYVTAVVHTLGLPAPVVLAESLAELIRSIPFGRSMRWLASAQAGEEPARTAYSRPIRKIVALFGAIEVPFRYAGLVSGRVTHGLRPAGSPDIAVASAGRYLNTMAANRIIVDPAERRETIRRQLLEVADLAGGTIPEDDALLEEVTHLVECPTAFLGSFSAEYLRLPKPVLITVMKKHQRYFPIVDESGDLKPNFIGVRNGGEENLEIVRRGNEGVLRARYSDAVFFFDADRKKTLEEFLLRLDTLTFQEDLGSMLDKSKRLEKLAVKVGEKLTLDSGVLATIARAAYLCKADLATNMVVELTSLQGIMGREYALLSGEKPEVADAIVEHYYPQSALPGETISEPGLALNLANRLDSLTGLFAAGKAPKGSNDPFALRREAISLITVLIETQTSFDIAEGVEMAASLVPIEVDGEAKAAVLEFVTRRLEGILRDEYSLPSDVVRAVLAERGTDPSAALDLCRELEAATGAGDWSDVLNAYARCVRIVRGVDERYTVDPEKFTEQAAIDLHTATQKAKSGLAGTESLTAVVDAVRTTLVDPINTFFDDVMVMAEDEDLRNNRLALLQEIRDLTRGSADFSELQGF